MSKNNVNQEQIDAVIDALLLPDKKRGKDAYTQDTSGLSWSDRQRKYFLMTGMNDPCVAKPSETITVREGESELSLTLANIPEGYDEMVDELLQQTLKFICHHITFGPSHPANLKQLKWFLEQTKTDF